MDAGATARVDAPLAPREEPTGALPRQVGALQARRQAKSWDRVAVRTVPGRENGGNCDIKNLSRGCAVYLPVFVPGANLSMGDKHFSQGDGEVSFCGAIEMSGWLDLKCSVIKGGMSLLPAVGPSPLSVNPVFGNRSWEPSSILYLRASASTRRANSTTSTRHSRTSAAS